MTSTPVLEYDPVLVPPRKARLSRKGRRMMRRYRGPRNWLLRRQPGKDEFPGIRDKLGARVESASQLPESAFKSRRERM
jgi:hypothetical protein